MHTDAWHEMGRRCAPRVARAPPRLWPVQMTRLGCRPPESSASAFPRCRCGFSSSMTAANCCRKPAQPQGLFSIPALTACTTLSTKFSPNLLSQCHIVSSCRQTAVSCCARQQQFRTKRACLDCQKDFLSTGNQLLP